MRRLSRQAWIEGALRMLDAGPEGGLSIERLARQLGVTRGSFYHHFSARKALVVALLERWEDTHTRQVIRQASEVADGPQRLRAWVEAVAALPKGREVALRRWADRDSAVRASLERVERERRGFVRALTRSLAPQATDALVDRLARFGYLAFIGLQQSSPRDRACLTAFAEDWLALVSASALAQPAVNGADEASC
jgi:AcrR family transcriptional regulator